MSFNLTMYQPHLQGERPWLGYWAGRAGRLQQQATGCCEGGVLLLQPYGSLPNCR